MGAFDKIRSGLPGMDELLNYIRMGDNVVFSVSDLEDFKFFAVPFAEQAIRDGREYGTVCQNPYGMGYAAVVAALRAASGQTVDNWIDPGYQWVDRNNIDVEENKKYLYL